MKIKLNYIDSKNVMQFWATGRWCGFYRRIHVLDDPCGCLCAWFSQRAMIDCVRFDRCAVCDKSGVVIKVK